MYTYKWITLHVGIYFKRFKEDQRIWNITHPLETWFRGLVVGAIVVALILIILENMVLQVNAGGIFYNLLRPERRILTALVFTAIPFSRRESTER